MIYFAEQKCSFGEQKKLFGRKVVELNFKGLKNSKIITFFLRFLEVFFSN